MGTIYIIIFFFANWINEGVTTNAFDCKIVLQDFFFGFVLFLCLIGSNNKENRENKQGKEE